MTAFKLEQFGGQLPAWDDHLIPAGQAASSVNAYLFSGALTGWRVPKLLHTLTNSSAAFAYRIPLTTQGTASNTLTVLSTPHDGDAVKVGEETYTFRTTISVAYDVLIGASATDAAANLFNALTLGPGIGTAYGLQTCVNDAISQVAGANTIVGAAITVVAPDFGTAYNTTVSTETTAGVRLSWASGATFAGGTNQVFDSAITSNSTWLEFLDHDTDVIRSPVVDDKYHRFYFASPSLPPKYNTYDRIVAGNPAWLLGVNPPGCNPGVTVTGGGDTAQFGNVTSTNTGTTNVPANTMYAFKITASGSMQLNDIAFMPQSTSTTVEYTAILYDDNNGTPGTLLNVGETQVGTTAGTQATSPFLNPTGLLDRLNYWVGIIVSETITVQNGDNNSLSTTAAATFANGAPGNFVAPSGYTPLKVQSIVAVDATNYIYDVTLTAPTNIDLIAADPTKNTVGVGNDPVVDQTFGVVQLDALAGSTVVRLKFDGYYAPFAALPGNIITHPPANPTLGIPSSSLHGATFVAGSTPNNQNIQMWADLTTSSVLDARAYLYTYVTEYEEESPPSPPTLVNGWSNGTWVISVYAPPPDDMGVLRNVKTVRLYRTVSAVGGQTTYFWVADYDLNGNVISNVTTATGVLPGSVTVTGPAEITDTLGDDVVANNTQLPSTNWFPPPEGLLGMRSMPNGITVGFKQNEIWFSEPYRPHAWPPGYVVTTEFPIVGIGTTMQACVVCTNGNPYVVAGVNPASMALTKVDLPEPCTSRGSILSATNAVYYTSQNGLISVDQSGQGVNTTQTWITREKWQQLTPQKHVHAILLASSYFAFGVVENGDHSTAQSGFTIELTAADSQSFTIWPQPGGHRVGFTQLTAPGALDIYNVMQDPWTGVGLMIQNGGVYYYDFTDPAPTIMPYTWRSKLYQQTTKKSFEAMKIYFTVPPGTPAQGATRNTADTSDPSWNTLGANQYGIVRVYGDGVLVTTREIWSSGELLRILSGFKADTWQWEFTGRVLISNMQAGTSAKELGGV